jgi:hypothetical protein
MEGEGGWVKELGKTLDDKMGLTGQQRSTNCRTSWLPDNNDDHSNHHYDIHCCLHYHQFKMVA